MKHTGFRVVFVGAAACLVAAFSGCGKAKVERVEWTTMGTIAAVQYRPWSRAILTSPAMQVDDAKRCYARIEKLLNAHDPSSELNCLAPLPEDEIIVRCDPGVSNCYAAAFRLVRESGGAFNPRWRGANTLDLGAIAKGFALDCVYHNRKLPILHDLGGTLKCEGSTWQVGIAGSDIVITLTNGMACATSAEYFRGKHIYDGRTGLAVTNGLKSVTVVHPTSATLADGLSTTLFVLGREEGEKFLKKHYPEARAYWVEKD